MKDVRIDLNLPRFQDDLFSLPVEEATRLFVTLRKIRQLTWEQIYSDRGLHWEAIRSKTGPSGERIYSFRASKKIRVVAAREGEWLRLVSIHPDHDSAYQ